jgi:hypothetical protein
MHVSVWQKYNFNNLTFYISHLAKQWTSILKVPFLQVATNDGVNNQPAIQYSLSNLFQTVEVTKIRVSWGMMPYKLVNVYQLSTWTCCLHCQAIDVYIQPSSSQMLETTGFLKMLLFFYQTIWYHTPKGHTLVTYSHRNFKFHIYKLRATEKRHAL